jgi:hypothetical protein
MSESEVTEKFLEAFDLMLEQVCRQLQEAGADGQVVWTAFREALNQISIAAALIEIEEIHNPSYAEEDSSAASPFESRTGTPSQGTSPSHRPSDPRTGRLREMARRAAGR